MSVCVCVYVCDFNNLLLMNLCAGFDRHFQETFSFNGEEGRRERGASGERQHEKEAKGSSEHAAARKNPEQE